MKSKNFLNKLILVVFLFITSCEKLVDVSPPITSSNGENVFNEDASAIAVITSVYTNMSNTYIASTTGWLTNICFTTGLTGDELKLWNVGDQSYFPYYSNNIPTLESTWANIYRMIFIANSAIEHLPNGTSLTPEVRKQLLGEARFIRALCYFYLINLYGDVPLAITTDYTVNRLLPRTSVSVIYNEIISDLLEAQLLMDGKYVGKDGITETVERIRPNKWTATALLSRVYLYVGRYSDAELQATTLINENSLYSLTNLNNVFLKNSKEAIWQLQPVGVESDFAANTREGQLFNLHALGNSDAFTVYLDKNLVLSFDSRDLRRYDWINSVSINGDDYFFPYKYKLGLEGEPTKEYSTVLRLAEQYLVRAEARIQQGKISEGVSDLNIIRERATDLDKSIDEQLPKLSLSLSKDVALAAVEKERRFELFTEWGHRWFDLKRTNRIGEVLGGYKPDWQNTDQLFPLPQGEVDQNPNLRGHQNPGYN